MYVEDVEKIKEDYMSGLKYSEIEEKHNITNNRLIYLIQKNKWKRKSNRSKLLKNNNRAKGNKGGPGAEKGNKRAVTTGEYETIFFDILSEDEKQLYESLVINNKKQCIEAEYKKLTIREYRILKRIKNIQDKNKDMNIERIVKRQYNSTLSNETETVTEAINVITPLQRLEDSLTKVQDAKRKCIDSLHKMETDDRRLELDIIRLEIEAARDDATNTEDIKDDSFIKALNGATEEVWNDYTEDD